LKKEKQENFKKKEKQENFKKKEKEENFKKGHFREMSIWHYTFFRNVW